LAISAIEQPCEEDAVGDFTGELQHLRIDRG
jgi:hypothetical protein